MTFVTCRCCTYNRPALIPEAVESFLRQDYEGKKELLILNDTPGLFYKFEHPEVRVINKPERYEAIGNKLNDAARMANGTVIIPWADDDIQMPWAISTHINNLGDLPAYVFNGLIKFWRDSNDGIHTREMKMNATGYLVIKKDLFLKVGGWNEGHPCKDTHFLQKIKAKFKYVKLQQKEYFLLWRRGKWNHPDVPRKGIIQIKPFWKYDYRKHFKR